MQASAPEMLSLEMIYGNRAGLQDRNSILLSHSLAKKLFANADPVDKIVQIDATTNVKVTGVFKDLPNNTEFRTTTFIAPFDLYNANKVNWNNYNMSIYAQLATNADIDEVSSKIKNLLSDKTKDQEGTPGPLVFPNPT